MPTCPREGCDEPVRKKKADEMPTLEPDNSRFKSEFWVRYCNNGHVLRYEDKQLPNAKVE